MLLVIPNAEDARSTIEERRKAKLEEIAEEIQEGINDAIKRMDYIYPFEGFIPPVLREELEEKGYILDDVVGATGEVTTYIHIGLPKAKE